MKKVKKVIFVLLVMNIICMTMFASALAEERAENKKEALKAATQHPEVTTDSVTWQGGLLEIPVDLKGADAKNFRCQVGIDNSEFVREYLMDTSLTGSKLTASIVGGFWSCEKEQKCCKKGNHTLEVTFLDAVTYNTVCTETLNLIIPEDSKIWRTTETKLKFDGSEDVVFHFQNGTNYYKLRAISNIEIFTGMGNVGAPFPVLTDGFKADMSAGILTIDKNVLKDAIANYVTQGGYLGDEVFVNVTALTEAGEEIFRFDTVNWKEEYGGITTITAWKLDVTGLNLSGKQDSSASKPDKKVKVSKVKITGLSNKIAAGKKITLKVSVTPSNASNKKVTWKSNNTRVATVNQSGVVTLKKNSGGKSVTITATAKDGSKKKATYKITSMKGVVKKVAISGKKTRTLKAGKTLKLKAKVTASNSKQANKTLKWTSSNTKYATVSSAGKVKTKKAGRGKTVKITAASTDGSNKKASVKVKLK